MAARDRVDVPNVPAGPRGQAQPGRVAQDQLAWGCRSHRCSRPGIESFGAASSHRNLPTRILGEQKKLKSRSRVPGSYQALAPGSTAPHRPPTETTPALPPRQSPISSAAAKVSLWEGEAVSFSRSHSGAQAGKYNMQIIFKHARPQAAFRNQVKSCKLIKIQGWKRFFRASSCCQ